MNSILSDLQQRGKLKHGARVFFCSTSKWYKTLSSLFGFRDTFCISFFYSYKGEQLNDNSIIE